MQKKGRGEDIIKRVGIPLGRLLGGSNPLDGDGKGLFAGSATTSKSAGKEHGSGGLLLAFDHHPYSSGLETPPATH